MEDNLKTQFREKVLDKVECAGMARGDEHDENVSRQGVFGMTTGQRPPGDKDTLW